jgi:trk system potassium uptake protein TrkA
MRVVVIGAGQVGVSIAQELQHDHDVVVIERSRKRLAFMEQFDVMTIRGNGASLKVLQDINVEESDLLIACTDIDEVNIVACAASTQLGAPFTIARVHDPEYIETWEKGYLGVDFMVCSELLTSERIAQLIGVPLAQAVFVFAEGRILMDELEIQGGSPMANRLIKELEIPKDSKIVGLIRGPKIVIPNGDSEILPGDVMVTVGTPSGVAKLNRQASGESLSKDVVIIGGGRIGYRLASSLEKQGFHPKLVEFDEERSRWLAEQLPNTEVFQADGTDISFLEEERIEDCDVAASVMNTDEKNLLSSLLLKRLGVRKVIAGVVDTHYIEIFERVGVDVAVSARKVIADEIIRFTRSRVTGIPIVEGERAAVREIVVSATSPLIGVPLSESCMPKGAIIGGIVRDHQVIIPGGDDIVEVDDWLIVLSQKEVGSEVEALL